MTSDIHYTRLSSQLDAEAFSQLLAQSFVADVAKESAYMAQIGLEHLRAVYHGSSLLGGLAAIPMGQWFGGRQVAMTGIAAVCIAPSARGSGAGLSLMQETMRELHQQRVPISTLYPAVQQLYRRVGYEQGGTYCRWAIAANAIGISKSPLPVTPVALEAAVFQALAQQQAQQHNGLLARNRLIWQRILSEAEQPRYAYCFGPSETPEGYVILSQTAVGDPYQIGTYNQLNVVAWAALTPAAVASLWAFLSSHRSQIKQICWSGSAVDCLSMGLPEQPAQPMHTARWLTRIICVEEALAARGYPLGLSGELHLAITDELLPENQGKWVLAFDQGQGQLRRGGQGDLKLDVRGLASLYTGLFSPQQLQQMGYLEGPEAALALAGQAFGGASPWLADFF